MMFLWKPDMIRFMRDASEYGDYNRELANIIVPHLEPDSHICDAGCGLGYLSLELAKTAGKVTSVDINQDALSVLYKNCENYSVSNIEIICGDVFSAHPEEKYSAMVFCYFGDIETILRNADRLCRGPIFIFKRNYEIHRFSEGSCKKETDSYEAARRKLDRLGVRYKAFELENEFGQPFRSMEDACLFFELYSQDGNKRLITDLRLLDRITYTGREDFPLYMPYRKKTGCIIINPRETVEQ